MTTETTIQFQNRVPLWANTLPVRHIKCIDPPADNPAPDKEIWGRVYLNDTYTNSLVRMGEAGADIYFAHCQSYYARAPYVTYWFAPNEPDVSGVESVVALARFSVRFDALMRSIGKTAVLLNTSRGCPDFPMMKYLVEVFNVAKWVSFHEYGWPTMMTETPYHCGRFNLLMDEVRKYYTGPMPQVCIGEANVDDGGANGSGKHWSWKTAFNHNFSELVNNARWYHGVCATSKYAVGPIFYYIAEPNGDWQDFEINETNARQLVSINDEFHKVDIPAEMLREAELRQLIHLNPNAAIQKRIFYDGYVPTSEEFSMELAGDTYVGQRAERLSDGKVRVYYCKAPDWGIVYYKERTS